MTQPSHKQPAPRHLPYWRHILHALLLAITLALPAAAIAQPSAAPGAAPITSGEVKIELESFGLGNVSRVGDWTGIRLKVTDTGTKSRDLIIRVAGLDFDGDTPLYQRVIASNPGSPMSVWIYVRLPFSYNPANGLPAYAYEALDETANAGEESGQAGRRAGRLLGFTDLRAASGPSGVVREASQALIAMVGPQARPLGLTDYSASTGGSALSRGVNPNAHEITNIVAGLNPALMPDRWIGLEPFDAVVWAQGDPVQLDEPRSNALREYVEHGGHLVIILPSINQTWTDQRSNKLLDIMPVVSLSQKDVDDFDRYRPLLARQLPPGAPKSTQPPFPKKMSVYTFTPRPDANPGEAVRILNGPDGDCVVVRRLVGAGAITLVGLDLNHTGLSQYSYIDADMFWHRILGRRGDYTPKPQQAGSGVFGGSRKIWVLDEGIADEIAEQGDAAAGVLVGFVVFLLYWLVAAPVGFFLLKRFNKTQHAWLAFVATTAVFTVISWTGAKLLRPSTVGGSHLTILDHVYGQPYQRAKMWSSVSIPRYGTATLSIGEQDTGGAPLNNLIASWDTPADGTWGGFPDVRGYTVDTRRPDSIRVPVRSTVKQVEVIWAGGPRWEMPRPLRPEEKGYSGAPQAQEARTLPDGTWAPAATGTLVHNMPGALSDGQIVVVRRQRNVTRYSSSNPVCVGNVFKIGYAWQPNTPLDLSTITKSIAPKDSNFNSYMNTQLRMPEGSGGTNNFDRRFAALAMFNQLTPNEQGLENSAAQRMATHGWDLSYWFTQPCIIVLGTVGADRGPNSASPVPLLVDGEPVPNKGRTVVRWIYPLPDDPPPFPPSQESTPTDQPTAEPTDTPGI